MDMEGALRARLLAASAVTALVAQRVYWLERPQASALPAITLQTIDDDYAQHMTGFQDMRKTLVQIDAWARSYAESKALQAAIIAAIVPAQTGNGIRFGRAFVRARDFFERTETQSIFRASLDFTIHHTTA